MSDHGWFLQKSTRKYHYYLNGSSLCIKYSQFEHPLPPLTRPLPRDRFCKICMRLLCDTIIIAGIPVDLAPIRTYIRHSKKHPDYSELIHKLLQASEFGSYDETFEWELGEILDEVSECPHCYITIDREGSCEECGKYITVKIKLNTLEKIADKTRRSRMM